MRWLVHILAIACTVFLIVVLNLKWSREASEATQIASTISAIREIERTVRYNVEYNHLRANERGWPERIEQSWFRELPRNELVSSEHPWMEIATEQEAALRHPPVRMMVNHTLAGLWYNPYQGVVRARVPIQVSDQAALTLYNRVNGTNLSSLLEAETPTDPVPLVRPPQGKSRVDGEPFGHGIP